MQPQQPFYVDQPYFQHQQYEWEDEFGDDEVPKVYADESLEDPPYVLEDPNDPNEAGPSGAQPREQLPPDTIGNVRARMIQTAEQFVARIDRLYDINEDEPIPVIIPPERIDISLLMDEAARFRTKHQVSTCILSHAILHESQSKFYTRVRGNEQWDNIDEYEQRKYILLYKFFCLPDNLKLRILRDYWRGKQITDFPLQRKSVPRFNFDLEHVEQMEEIFQTSPTPTNTQLDSLRERFCVPLIRIQNWFRNRRYRERKGHGKPKSLQK